jgi:Flp pilus assembly protein TadG
MNRRALCNAKDNKRTTILSRLSRDTRGNTLAIVGAAFIPLTAMIGSGVDISRAYMAKSRLQSACDSAALAGRRVLSEDTMTAKVETEAKKFVNFNFPQGTYDTDPFVPEVSKPSRGTIRVSLATAVPTSIMKIFGYAKLPISVNCEASQNFVNTDIVLVLDVTGSMGSGGRIEALRDAVMALYDELEPIQKQLEANGLRLRYGIVPYSSNVNAGRLIQAAETAAATGRPASEAPDYIVDNWYYHSRRPIYRGSTITTEESRTRDECFAVQKPRTPTEGYPAEEIMPVWASTGGARRTCTIIKSNFNNDRDAEIPNYYKNSGWRWGITKHDVTAYIATEEGIPTPNVQDNDPGEWQTSKWAGCIEERDTLSSITTSTNLNIPEGAYDLQINRIPDAANDGTKWRPFWPEILQDTNLKQHWLYHGAERAACPAPAMMLQPWSRSDLQDYVNALQPTGNTYHDIGMVWGGRLISPTGIFAYNNPTVHREMPVARHIIYMTDGELVTASSHYTFHGIEMWDKRVLGNANASTLNSRHDQRFRMACNAAKATNTSIWVIAFGVDVTDSLRSCASSASQVSASSDRDDLIEKFTEIGKNIGSLRLTL